jgi:hypothetical protein
MDPHFLDLGTSWRWVVSFTHLPLYTRERTPGTHWIGGRVDIRADLDDVKKRKFLILPGLELRTLGCPARSQSLYRKRYHVLKCLPSDLSPPILLAFSLLKTDICHFARNCSVRGEEAQAPMNIPLSYQDFFVWNNRLLWRWSPLRENTLSASFTTFVYSDHRKSWFAVKALYLMWRKTAEIVAILY